MVTFVLDNSVVMAILLDEGSAYADAVQASLLTTWAAVPSIWRYEVANALLVAERRGRFGGEALPRIRASLLALPLVHDDLTAEDLLETVQPLARSHQLSAYDAAYLFVAARRGLPLATLDARLRAAAERVGVRPFLG